MLDLAHVLPDLRFAVKSLRRSPGFTSIAVVTLALGIGANTSAFSILNGLLLRPLPYPETDRLERIYRATPQSSRGGVSPADYLDLASQAGGYGETAAYAVSEVSLAVPGEPADTTPGVRVSANLFSVLRAEPALGRGFRTDEDVFGNHRVVVLSHRCWQNRFGADARIVGRTIRVDGEPHQIVGVLPASLNDWRHLGAFDVFRPLALTPQERTDRSSSSLRVVGRRADGISRDQAQTFVASFGQRLAKDFPATHAGSTWRTLRMYDSVIPEGAAGVVGMLIGLSGFVLLIACFNLANLLLVRTVARSRELAVRSALGASRLRLLQPLFVESLLLACAGGLGAVQVAMWTHDWLNAFARLEAGDPVIFALDWRVLGWAFGAGLFTVLTFGVAPALYALRLDPNLALKSGARGTTGDRGHRRFRQVLIAGQFAFAMVLLSGAALFVRGLHDWNERQLGWDSTHLLTGTLMLPTTTYTADQDVARMQRLAIDRLEALPGVASASVSWSMPFFAIGEPRKYVVAGRDVPERGHEPVAATNGVSPRYFGTVGTRVVAGRAFDDRDTLTSPKVFVIYESMARGLFNGVSAVGLWIARVGGEPIEWGEVVGIVTDTRSVASDRTGIAYQLYVPTAQEPRRASEVAVRTAGVAPASLVASIRTALMSLDPDLPVRLQPAAIEVARAGNYQRIIGSLLSLLALLGLGLALLGIYGVVARTVAQRTGEFGIRLALGARGAEIARLVLASGAKLALVGSAIGLLGAVGVSRLIVAGFPGLQTSSAPVLAAITLLLVTVAQVACYLPARRAARISPSDALRAE
jgi:predicted permease